MKQGDASKVYVILRRAFFTIVYHVYKAIGTRDGKYYLAKWFADNAGNKSLIKYPLGKDSLVVDLGGYTGEFSDKIISLYNPNLLIIEPVNKFFKILKKKYITNDKVVVHKYGLSNRNGHGKIYLSGDGTSLLKRSAVSEKIKLLDVAEFTKKYNFIDLMSINIEGAEYDVLERLIDTGEVNKIRFLQIQFHNFVPRSDGRRNRLILKLRKTHRVRYTYPFVWESFELEK